MTVIDSSGVIDYLLGMGCREQVAKLVASERELTAPDVLVFEVLASVRRLVQRGLVEPGRALGAVADLGDFPVRLFASMPLRSRAWELRENVSAGDALFVALAEHLGEPLATGDRRLAAAVAAMPGPHVRMLVPPAP